MLYLDNICKYYINDDGVKTNVLNNFSLKIDQPLVYTILGPNGCGKTTLLNIISGIKKPSSGYIKDDNKILNNIGYVFQNYRSTLLPWLNVKDNIAFPLKIKGIAKQERYAIVERLLKEFNSELYPENKIYELSGGQQQLVNSYRNLIIKPSLLLLDEPFSALDQSNRWSMIFEFEKIWMALEIPILFISHDIDEAIILADEIILMDKIGNLSKRIKNNIDRPRNIEMMYTKEHVKLKREVVKFLFSQNKNSLSYLASDYESSINTPTK